ncbi:FapA family protein [Neobacillus sp. PS3-34]|uniref:FapA family protein n=1 Tax=Neobacillus sp. PS3-34 TaxID=3070678 RepID=UPI0027DFE477|nr:FapA family protein [Neobacillus sp. PS3-34]WML49524.1 FapA family protein [Neobacillus sp. PS3-34]
MQSIVSKGKDINEAISLGLEILETTKEKVNIEIMQHDEKGFLGIRSKQAIVKLTKSEHAPITFSTGDLESQLLDMIIKKEEAEINASPIILDPPKLDTLSKIYPDELAGKVWIKDGQLFCKSSPTHFPMVTINRGIKLYRNNEMVKEKTAILSEKDIYEIKVENEEKETGWKVSIDEQKLKVRLYVEPGYKIIRSVPDINADHHIEIIVEEKKEIHNVLNYADVMKKLEDLRVIHGFNQDEILKAMEASEPTTFEIATGMKPKQGKDGWIEIKVATEIEEGPREKEDGRVDFREIKTIPKAERGKVIAIVHPPTPGQIGYTVTNEPIPAKQTLPLVIKAGKGVAVADGKIVATEPGRPKIEQRGQLVKASIIPKLRHFGDVNLKSGNIRFIGDVEITGEIEERMVVEAEGDITVHKTVNTASITSSGAIISYGNIISSELSAGKNNMLVSELGHLLGIINQHTEKIIDLIKQLIQSPAFKSSDFSRGGLQPLIRILLEKKFKNFPPLIKNYIEAVRRGEVFLEDEVWRMTAVSLSQLFLSLTNEVTSLDRIIQLSEKMKELHELSENSVEPNSYITIPNALNSKLYCSGNVLILGQGCVNTKVHAGGILKISGILRGGEVYGRLGAEINEAGAESGTTTVIAVPGDQKIEIQKALEGTTIKIGNVKHTFKETRYHINARLDENERVIFE